MKRRPVETPVCCNTDLDSQATPDAQSPTHQNIVLTKKRFVQKYTGKNKTPQNSEKLLNVVRLNIHVLSFKIIMQYQIGPNSAMYFIKLRNAS